MSAKDAETPETKRSVGRPAPLGRKLSVTVRLTPAVIAWLDTWGLKQRSWAIEMAIRDHESFKADQKE